MIYKPKYFKLYEVFPKDFYLKYYPVYKERLWLLMDVRILKTYDQLRNRFGKIVMNDYHWGGRNHYRGWRPFDCPIGAELSQHKWGRGGDGIFMETPIRKVRSAVLKGEFKYVTAVERDVPWLHIDCRNECNTNVLLI